MNADASTIQGRTAARPAADPGWETTIGVPFADVDQAGIVYYPRLLHYCHLGMEEFFAARIGVPYPELIRRHQLGFPTVHAEVTFRRPLRYGDRARIGVAIAHRGTSSLRWRFRLRREDEAEPACEALVVTVCTDLARFGKVTIPSWLAERLPVD